jgi:hypothetical protein
MADDYTQRPYRLNELPARGQPGSGAGAGSIKDPLAELARLIGQNDPFSEYGRENARRPAVPPPSPAEPAPDWMALQELAEKSAGAGFPPQPAAPVQGGGSYYGEAQEHAAQPPLTGAQTFATANFARQPFGGAPLAASADPYQTGTEVPGYAAAPAGGAYEHDAFPPGNAQFGDEEDDFYNDAQARRRRIGVLAIAGVLALAVIGTAGAFGYRALFGSSSTSTPPPVIKAESAPSKIVPAAASKKAQSGKLITDRVNDRGQNEKLVSREEQPVAIGSTRPGNIVFPPGQNGSSASSMPMLGSGVVGSEPKRIRTIVIHPDQAGGASPAPMPAHTAAPASQQAQAAPVTPPRAAAPAPPMRISSAPQPEAEPAPRPRAAAPVHQAAPQPRANAPLSLSPNVSAPARSAPSRRTAAVAQPTRSAPAAVSSGAGGYAVQVSSQRSEAEAQAAFRSLQGKYPNQLGGQQVLIKRVDLGAKGIYFRAMVGPFGSSGEAGQLCSSLKSAGGQCIVQRN